MSITTWEWLNGFSWTLILDILWRIVKRVECSVGSDSFNDHFIWSYIYFCIHEHLHLCSAHFYPVPVMLICSTCWIWEKAIWSTTFSFLASRLFGAEKRCWWRWNSKSDSYKIKQRQHCLLYLMNDLSLISQNILYSLFPCNLNDPGMGERFSLPETFILALGPPSLLLSGCWDFFYPGVKHLGNKVHQG